MHLESLLQYYQNELEFLIEGGKTFAKQYPDLAKTLDFSAFSSNDPDIQRLIESVAFLNAKLQKRLDEQAPEISQQILNAIYPQFIAPIPSFTIMNFSYLTKPTNALRKIPRGAILTSNNKFNGNHYIFTTTMNVEIAPCSVQDILLIPSSEANLPFNIYNICNNAVLIRLENLMNANYDNLTFYIHMVDNLAYDFYAAILELFPNKPTPIFENGVQIGEIKGIGFDEDAALFPKSERENPAYNTLLEYNTFIKKFLFFKVTFTKQPEKEFVIPFNTKKEIYLKKDNLLLNCTPAINLFEKNSEPIVVNNKSINYLVSSDNDKKKNTDIYSVLSIQDTNTQQTATKYIPYFSSGHLLDNNTNNIFWSTNRTANKNLNQYETNISFFDTNLNMEQKIVYAKLLCFQNQANELVAAEEKWNIGNTPGNLQCINLEKPTLPIMPALSSRTQWRLISHLAINYFGFKNSENSLDYIKELFAIYDFQNSKNKNALYSLKGLEYKVNMVSFERTIVPKATIVMVADETKSSQVFLLAHILGKFFANILDFNTKLGITLKKESDNTTWKTWEII